MTDAVSATGVVSAAPAADDVAVTADIRAAARRRRVLVWVARLATLVVVQRSRRAGRQ